MSVVTVAEAREFLRTTNVATISDARLQGYLDEVEAAIAAYVGPLTSTATTCRVEGGRGQWAAPRYELALQISPAISLTSVIDPSGSAIDTALLHLDKDAAVVSYNDGYSRFTARYYDVVYAAGRTTVPEDLKLAIKELLKDYWSGTQRGGNGRPAATKSDTTSNTVPGALWDLPFKVSRLIGPHRQII